jgi:hypothetical protein
MADALNDVLPEVSPQLVVDIAKNLASLNEIVNALFSGLALGETPDEAFCNLVFETLREHSWRLGFTFNEERPPIGWHDKETARHLRGEL